MTVTIGRRELLAALGGLPRGRLRRGRSRRRCRWLGPCNDRTLSDQT